jgi:large repetitive protein
LKRIVLIVSLVALCAGVGAGSGTAASFDDTHPCPASGALLVCPSAQVGQPYSLQLIALAGCDNYWWEFTNGGLPPGLSLSRSGLISGTPTATGSTEPWVQVHDLTATQGGPPWCGGDNASQRQFVFNTVAGLSIQQQSVPGGTVNQPYSQQLTALSVTNLNPVQGSPAQATWSIKSGSLPAGVTLSSSGLLSGTPTAEGSYTFVVQAVGGGNATDTETETLTVRQPLTLTSQLTRAAKAEVGIHFTATETAGGGSGTFTWSVSKGALPAGLTLAPDGTVSGTPATAGHFSFTVTLADSERRTKSVDVTLVVANKLALKTVKLKAGKTGQAYRLKLVTVGGVGPMTWTATGKLPRGFKLGKTGLLFGTPTAAGNYRVTVTVTDSLGAVAKKTLTLPVKSKRHLKTVSR